MWWHHKGRRERKRSATLSELRWRDGLPGFYSQIRVCFHFMENSHKNPQIHLSLPQNCLQEERGRWRRLIRWLLKNNSVSLLWKPLPNEAFQHADSFRVTLNTNSTSELQLTVIFIVQSCSVWFWLTGILFSTYNLRKKLLKKKAITMSQHLRPCLLAACFSQKLKDFKFITIYTTAKEQIIPFYRL